MRGVVTLLEAEIRHHGGKMQYPEVNGAGVYPIFREQMEAAEIEEGNGSAGVPFLALHPNRN